MYQHNNNTTIITQTVRTWPLGVDGVYDVISIRFIEQGLFRIKITQKVRK